MPKNKRPIETTRTSSRRQASKEALKQMQLLLDDEEEDAFVIPDEEDDKDLRLDAPKKRTVSPVIESPPKKKYKLSHRKSSDGNDRDVIVLKSISNSNYVPKENTLELECFIEELSDVQKERQKKVQLAEEELKSKLDELLKSNNAEVVHQGEFSTAVEVHELISSCGKKSIFKPNQIPQLGAQEDSAPTYQLLLDPRLGLIIGTVQKPPPIQVPPSPPPVPKPKLQISSAVKAVANLPQSHSPPATRNMRSRRTPVSAPSTPVQTRGTNATPTRANSIMPTRANTTMPTRASAATLPTRASAATLPTRANTTIPTRANTTIPTRANTTIPTRANTTLPTRANTTLPTRANTTMPTRGNNSTPLRGNTTPPVKGNNASTIKSNTVTPTRSAVQVASPVPAIQTRAMKTAPTVQTRNSNKAIPAAKRPIPNAPAEKPKQVVDLTSEENRNQVDNREISFNKLQGKTYPSLVVVARPHLRVSDLGADRSKLDSKVKSVLMHPPTKFTEWLIQQGLIRAEQKCAVHNQMQLKLGMYSDVSKFPFSGGYVWISECCPQRFISVFNGSIFEGSPHPPMVMLKLIYHWSCQTNIQNVTQWVKVDNLYVKGVYTWLRGLCTLAVQTGIRQLGGHGCKIEVGVISLGTTSHDGNQRQVKVEVLGILESSSKFMRLRAVEPMPDGDRNFRKKFSKILEPILHWVHPDSTIITDLTVDKATLNQMGFMNVTQTTSNDYNNSNRTIMEYLRRIVPRMFQNTLSLLSRPIIQQFLDELVWREWFGITAQQAFDNIISHLAEQTRTNTHSSLVVKLNKVAANPFRLWGTYPGGNPGTTNNNPTPAPAVQPPSNPPAPTPTKTPVAEVKRYGRGRKSNSPQVQTVQERPTKPVSPDVPEQMVPLENYYYGTIESFDLPPPKVILSLKCPFCKLIFDNNLQLQNHLFKHAHNVSNDAYLCRYCLTSLSTANELLAHVNKRHAGETKFDNGFVCLICETHYMNPFVLGKHMSKEHCPHELPYECGSCGFRCSNHKQVIDHFHVKHDGGTTIQCPFCLKSTTVWSGGRNIAQNMHYFIQHLLKHQKKQLAKRCGKCNLWFVQKEVLKEHQQKMHISLRGRLGLVPCSSPRNGVMVPKSKVDKNPCDAEIINFSSVYYNIPNRSVCKECDLTISSPKHFPSFDSCQNPNCQYSTCCATAMMTHNAKCKGLNAVIPPEALPFKMYCVCGHNDADGNSMAKHLAICEKKSCYPSESEAKSATVMHSMLDILGLVRKPEEVAPKSVEKDIPQPEIEVKDKVDENTSDLKATTSNEINILSDDEDIPVEKVNSNKDDDVLCLEAPVNTEKSSECDKLTNEKDEPPTVETIDKDNDIVQVLDMPEKINDLERVEDDEVEEIVCVEKKNEICSDNDEVQIDELPTEKATDEEKIDHVDVDEEGASEKEEHGELKTENIEKNIDLEQNHSSEDILVSTDTADENVESESEPKSDDDKQVEDENMETTEEKEGSTNPTNEVEETIDESEAVCENDVLPESESVIIPDSVDIEPENEPFIENPLQTDEATTEEEKNEIISKQEENIDEVESEHSDELEDSGNANNEANEDGRSEIISEDGKSEIISEDGKSEIINEVEGVDNIEVSEQSATLEDPIKGSESVSLQDAELIEEGGESGKEISDDTCQLSNETRLCKDSVNENLHEDVLNDILSTADNAVTLDVDLENELTNLGKVGAPMEVD